MKGSYELDFDSLQFYIDEDYCHRSYVNDFPLFDQTVQLG